MAILITPKREMQNVHSHRERDRHEMVVSDKVVISWPIWITWLGAKYPSHDADKSRAVKTVAMAVNTLVAAAALASVVLVPFFLVVPPFVVAVFFVAPALVVAPFLVVVAPFLVVVVPFLVVVVGSFAALIDAHSAFSFAKTSALLVAAHSFLPSLLKFASSFKTTVSLLVAHLSSVY